MGGCYKKMGGVPVRSVEWSAGCGVNELASAACRIGIGKRNNESVGHAVLENERN